LVCSRQAKVRRGIGELPSAREVALPLSLARHQKQRIAKSVTARIVQPQTARQVSGSNLIHFPRLAQQSQALGDIASLR
jgi:hypothetical protein